MRVILETNVFVSGVFFRGPPYKILEAWRDGAISIVLSEEIFREYHRVGQILAQRFPGIDLDPFLNLLLSKARFYEVQPLPEQVCSDPADDMFLACALPSRCPLIVSGDKQLLNVSGYRRIRVVRPREFLDGYLQA